MKKCFITMTALAISASMLFGCAKPANNTAAPETTAATTEATTAAAEEETVATPFLNDLEKYDSVISELKAGQYFAFADICKDYDVLLVTDSVYDNGQGQMAAIEATLYGLDKDGKVFELGQVSSNGTAYPLAVYDGCLMFGGHHHVGEVFCDGENMITKKDASERFDDKGNAEYFYFDYDNKFEGQVEDNSQFMAMFEDYEKAIILNFSQPQSAVEGHVLTIMDNTVISPDGWKLTFDPEKFVLNETLGDEETAFNYIGECSGTAALFVSYVPDKMPDEALYEKVAAYDADLVERDEAKYGKDNYWAHFRTILPEKNPAENTEKDLVYQGFVGIEHNGGTVIIEQLQHEEKDDKQYSDIVNAFSELTNTFELVDHEPQTEYAYVVGSYVHKYTDEIGGEKIECTDKVVMNDDHTCTVSFQDDLEGEWTGTEIRLNNAQSNEYSVEGDKLYFDKDGEWIEFEKEA